MRRRRSLCSLQWSQSAINPPLTVLQTRTQNFVGGLGLGFEWIDVILLSHYQEQHGDHNETGVCNLKETPFGDTCNRRASHALAFFSMNIKRRQGRRSSQCYVPPLKRNEPQHFLFWKTNCYFLLILCHWNLRLNSHLLCFLSCLNILVLSVLRKFVLTLRPALWFMHLNGVSRAYGLSWVW